MKLSHNTKDKAARVFDLFLYVQYLADLGEPVFDDLDDVRISLEQKYSKSIAPVTNKVVNDTVKCSVKLFVSNKEGWSRIPTGLLTVVSTYVKSHPIDVPNLQEYICQSMTKFHHADKISFAMSELDNIDILIDESIAKFENGIKYGEKHNLNELESSRNKQMITERKRKHYDDVARGL